MHPHTRKDRKTLQIYWGKTVNMILAENPALELDMEIARKVCLRASFRFRSREVGPNPTIGELLRTFGPGHQKPFLAIYVEEWKGQNNK